MAALAMTALAGFAEGALRCGRYDRVYAEFENWLRQTALPSGEVNWAAAFLRQGLADSDAIDRFFSLWDQFRHAPGS